MFPVFSSLSFTSSFFLLLDRDISILSLYILFTFTSPSFCINVHERQWNNSGSSLPGSRLARLEYPGWLETMTRNARSFLKYFSRAASRRFALLRRRFKFRSVVSDGKKAGRAPRPVRGRAWNKDLRKSRGEHKNERETEKEKEEEKRERKREIKWRGGGSGRVAHTSRSTSPLKFASARRANIDEVRPLIGPHRDQRQTPPRQLRDAVYAAHACYFQTEQSR